MAEKVVEIGEGNEAIAIEMGQDNDTLKERKVSWRSLLQVDSLRLEAGRVPSYSHANHNSKCDWSMTLSLAFQSIGIVCGDIGTSPLYVYASTFPNGIKRTDDVIGVLSLIIYTIILVPMIKYVFIVLWANDNGDGGTFALYSLICRNAKVSLIPNQQPEDSELSNYKLETPTTRRAQKIKQKLESSNVMKIMLFLLSILGTSMVIGDGVLTPCISVISAVSGITSLGTHTVTEISIGILIVLFAVQRFGTDKMGFSFAPIICIWFLFISGIGLYNLFKYNVGVLRAFNPKYIIDYFMRNGKDGWTSLGGIVLCITGTEIMFADLGHFNVQAIQISFSCVVLPALLTAYSGQAAYLTKFPDDVKETFYKSIPSPIYWPTFVVAVAAAIIASQGLISGAFAIISQSLSLGCFPRVKVIHTSAKFAGQVYIPEINYLLMIACVIVCASFTTSTDIANAYGIAVLAVMIITTCLLTLVMLVIWKIEIWWIVLFFAVFMSIEIVYLSSALFKFVQGGYLPLAFAAVLMGIMGTWHYVHRERYLYELKNKVSHEYIRELAANPDATRVPGIALLYSELVQGVPPIFKQFIDNIPSIHSVIVVVTIKSLPISRVALDERFLFRQVQPREYKMYRCVVRYGYNDPIEEAHEFECQLVENLMEYIRDEYFIQESVNTEEVLKAQQPDSTPCASSASAESFDRMAEAHVSASAESFDRMAEAHVSASAESFDRMAEALVQASADEEVEFVQRASEKGIVYLIGEAEVVAEQNSSYLKKVVVNYVYRFLRKNCRQGEKLLLIPRNRLLRVGMTYEI